MIPDLLYAACIAIFIVIVVHIADDLAWRYRRWKIRRQVFRRISREIKSSAYPDIDKPYPLGIGSKRK